MLATSRPGAAAAADRTSHDGGTRGRGRRYRLRRPRRTLRAASAWLGRAAAAARWNGRALGAAHRAARRQRLRLDVAGTRGRFAICKDWTLCGASGARRRCRARLCLRRFRARPRGRLGDAPRRSWRRRRGRTWRSRPREADSDVHAAECGLLSERSLDPVPARMGVVAAERGRGQLQPARVHIGDADEPGPRQPVHAALRRGHSRCPDERGTARRHGCPLHARAACVAPGEPEWPRPAPDHKTLTRPQAFLHF